MIEVIVKIKKEFIRIENFKQWVQPTFDFAINTFKINTTDVELAINTAYLNLSVNYSLLKF